MDVEELLELCGDEVPKFSFRKRKRDVVNKSFRSLCSLASEVPSSATLCKQFWKAGDHQSGEVLQSSTTTSGHGRLRVHPRFLHSNATSHKWAFGAVAELLDNAVDEAQHGASSVFVDRIKMKGQDVLLIQDDGRGMNPESLRRCMSFGFSDKQSDSFIGHYGNGFKTSSMRLGADAIVFTCCTSGRTWTQSVGLLSYTFLRQTGAEDIVVPMVDYVHDPDSGLFRRILFKDDRQFTSNLTTLLKWSPFSEEMDLFKEFYKIGPHGTKILVFNLWLNDAEEMELDFESDPKDILINGAPKQAGKMKATQSHIANKFRYSLRAYASILYLHLPNDFKLILRGHVVEPHFIVHDLKFHECIRYRPQVKSVEAEVITTVGFLKEAPHSKLHGFSVYHKNRLILPFWPVLANTKYKCRGVAGILEANCIKPTHDKQDFEKSILFQRLETRLREMTTEYWDCHCHLVGFQPNRSSSVPVSGSTRRTVNTGLFGVQESDLCCNIGGSPVTSAQLPDIGTHFVPVVLNPSFCSIEEGPVVVNSVSSPLQNSIPLNATLITIPEEESNICEDGYSVLPTGLTRKRRCETEGFALYESNLEASSGGIATKRSQKVQLTNDERLKRKQKIQLMMDQKKNLYEACLKHEMEEKMLLLQKETLIKELQTMRLVEEKLLFELQKCEQFIDFKMIRTS